MPQTPSDHNSSGDALLKARPACRSVGPSGVCPSAGDGSLDVLDGDIEGLGQGFEDLSGRRSFSASGLPPDVGGRRHVRSNGEGAGTQPREGAQTSQIGWAPRFEEVCCTHVQSLGKPVEHFRSRGRGAQLPA